MPIRVSFAEQATGIVTATYGERTLGPATFERFDGMTEAMAAVRSYLEIHPDHEAWVGSSVSSHRIVLPSGIGFDTWFEQFWRDGNLGDIAVGITYGEVVTRLGWPDMCSTQLRRSPMATIFRYGPKHVDFHFDDGGRLWLVHMDDLDDPQTILKG
jgi:hypothetical protein